MMKADGRCRTRVGNDEYAPEPISPADVVRAKTILTTMRRLGIPDRLTLPLLFAVRGPNYNLKYFGLWQGVSQPYIWMLIKVRVEYTPVDSIRRGLEQYIGVDPYHEDFLVAAEGNLDAEQRGRTVLKLLRSFAISDLLTLPLLMRLRHEKDGTNPLAQRIGVRPRIVRDMVAGMRPLMPKVHAALIEAIGFDPYSEP